MINFTCSNERTIHIYRAILLIFFLLLCNSLYLLLRENLGYPFVSFLSLKNDRFADILKYGLSFKDLFIGFDESEYFQKLQSIFKNYLLNNPYAGVEGFNNEQNPHTHFMHPPIIAMLSILFAKLLTFGVHPESTMIIYLLLNSALFIYACSQIFKEKEAIIASLILFTINYPSLLIYTRGNLAGFTSLAYIIFILLLQNKRENNYYSTILYCIALPFRFTSIIFLTLQFKLLSINKSIHECIKIALLSAVICFISYIIMQYIYPVFTFENYLMGTEKMSKYLFYNFSFHPHDASLPALIRNIGIFSADSLKNIYLISIMVVLPIAAYSTIKAKTFTEAVYICVVIYFIAGPTSGFYHLTLYTVPILVSYFEHKATNIKAITIFCALMLSPWTYYISTINIQPFIIHCIQIFSLMYLFITYLTSRWKKNAHA